MAESDRTSARIEIKHRTALPNPYISHADEGVDPPELCPGDKPKYDSNTNPNRQIFGEFQEFEQSQPFISATSEPDDSLSASSLESVSEAALSIESLVPVLDLESGDSLRPTISGKPLRGIPIAFSKNGPAALSWK
jgi:hypothetical protein